MMKAGLLFIEELRPDPQDPATTNKRTVKWADDYSTTLDFEGNSAQYLKLCGTTLHSATMCITLLGG